MLFRCVADVDLGETGADGPDQLVVGHPGGAVQHERDRHGGSQIGDQLEVQSLAAARSWRATNRRRRPTSRFRWPRRRRPPRRAGSGRPRRARRPCRRPRPARPRHRRRPRGTFGRQRQWRPRFRRRAAATRRTSPSRSPAQQPVAHQSGLGGVVQVDDGRDAALRARASVAIRSAPAPGDSGRRSGRAAAPQVRRGLRARDQRLRRARGRRR